jgi:hypothetical protein
MTTEISKEGDACWHVFGLLHKSEKNLKAARRCYLNAPRKDPGNQINLRGLAALQVQVTTFFDRFGASNHYNLSISLGT